MTRPITSSVRIRSNITKGAIESTTTAGVGTTGSTTIGVVATIASTTTGATVAEATTDPTTGSGTAAASLAGCRRPCRSFG
jgi:hypothetical protein